MLLQNEKIIVNLTLALLNEDGLDGEEKEILANTPLSSFRQ